ncbi:YppG family protein [Neobacillus sp. LXY-1]|uniref:YppG family protein n=1 Tax=Neobacillus sp. LXY-1 TaxID=3379133 RepID=UPI003EE2917E
MFERVKQYRNNQFGNPGQMMQNVPYSQQMNPMYFRTQQPFPYPLAPQNYGWQPYQQQSSYLQQSFQLQGAQPGFPTQHVPNFNQSHYQKDSQFLFHNPLQPKEEMIQQPYMPMNGYPIMNPYPKNNVIPKQPGGMQSFMNSFKSQDGSVDFNKMVNTAGQMVNAVTQVGSLIKGFGGIFKA